MSRAFTKEGDAQWLSDVMPTLNALIVFLTQENNGIRVVEEKRTYDRKGREIHHMSNGLAYVKDDEGRWSVARDEEQA
jgi:hypothetical protein